MIELKISADAIALAQACDAGIVYAARQRRGLAVVENAWEVTCMMLRETASTASTTSHTPLLVTCDIGVVMETGRSGRFTHLTSSAREVCG